MGMKIPSPLSTSTERFKDDISIPEELDDQISISFQTPPISSLKKKAMFSPDPKESAISNPVTDVLNFVEQLEAMRQDGTPDYPFIRIVNQDFSERNDGICIMATSHAMDSICGRRFL
jgi:hypothetical protein